jgi:hypothetical protein
MNLSLKREMSNECPTDTKDTFSLTLLKSVFFHEMLYSTIDEKVQKYHHPYSETT